jgi:hypothetical protein
VVTLPAGSTVTEARRHIVLRKFADAGGDLSRAAKLAGMSEADMRTELLAMVGPGTGSRRNGATDAEEDEQPDAQPKPAERPARKKAAAKPRERKTTGKGRRSA